MNKSGYFDYFVIIPETCNIELNLAIIYNYFSYK